MGKKFKIGALVNLLVPNWVMWMFQVVGLAFVVGGVAKKIEAMPADRRKWSLAGLRLVEGLFFFALPFLYGYKTYVLPASKDSNYGLILLMVLFTSSVMTAFLCVLVNTIVTRIVEMTRMVDRGTQVVGDGSRAVTETAKKAIDATQKGMAQAKESVEKSSKVISDATKKGVETTAQWVKETTPKVQEAVERGVKASEEFIKDKKPVIEKAVTDGSKKVIDVTKKGADITAKLAGEIGEKSKEAIEKTQEILKEKKINLNVKSWTNIFKKKDDPKGK